MAKKKFVEYSTSSQGGEWFNLLASGQKIEGTVTKTFEVSSKFKNQREKSPCFGKKVRQAWEISTKTGKILFTERGGGPLQTFLDACKVGSAVIMEYQGLQREDGEMCPASVKTPEQYKKWKGGKRTMTFPVFKRLAMAK